MCLVKTWPSQHQVFSSIWLLLLFHTICQCRHSQCLEMHMLPRLHPDMSCHATVYKLLSFLNGCRKDRGASLLLSLDCPHVFLPQFNQRNELDICLIHPALYIFFFSKRLKLSGKMLSPQKLNGEFGFDMFIYCTGIIRSSGLKEI